MKKITHLIALMMVSLGFSQVPKIDFETNGAYSIKALNLSSATVGTGTGTNTTMVANLSKGLGQYDNPFEIILKNQISFASTGVKTITFDFYQTTATARPILVQVSAGTGDSNATGGYEVLGSTAATAGWQTLSFNFASCRESYPAIGTNKNIVGSYKKMYIFIDFALNPASTCAIDNIGGGTQGAAIVVAPTLSNFAISSPKSVGSSFQLTAPTSNSPGAFTYTSSNTALATISGTTVSVVGAGNVTITATQAADAPYSLGSITATFTATNLTVPTLGALVVPNKVFGDPTFNLTPPTTNSGGAFTYTSSNTAVATISGSTVTIVGVGNSTITATQAATASYATGSATATLTVSVPAAPTPTKAAEDVISIFSNAYTDIAGTDFFPNWGQSTQYVQENGMLKYSNLNYQGITFASPINGAVMEKLHIDIWTRDCSSFQMFVLDGSAPEQSVTLTPSFNGWNSYDINLADYTSLTKSNLVEFKFLGNGTVYLDNIYFWENLPAGTPTISFSIPAKSVSDAPFSLTSLITSNSSGVISYTSSNTAVATVSGSTVTIVGIGSTTITANQAANAPYIAGTATAVLDVNPVAAPIPPAVTPSSVIGLYGETYLVEGYQYPFGELAAAPDLDPTAGVNNALKVDFSVGGYGQGFTTKDISAMQYVHFDYYTTNATTFALHLMSDAPFFDVVYNIPGIVKNQWVSVNIPMSTFNAIVGFNATKFIQFKFGTAELTPGTVYFDNLYFSLTNPALGTEKFETSKMSLYPNPVKNTLNIEAKGSIERVAVYSILGQEVMSKSPKSNATTLQTSGLQKGTYIVKSTIDGKTSTSKFIKE